MGGSLSQAAPGTEHLGHTSTAQPLKTQAAAYRTYNTSTSITT